MNKSQPVSYEVFCNKYELELMAANSKEQYQEYIDNLNFMQTAMKEGAINETDTSNTRSI